MKTKVLYKAFIIGFVLLYIATALISFCHAISFFNIGNSTWMSYTLAGVFEIGQMVVLSSLLLSDNKKTIMPWILLIVLTTVQVVGNVFSVYKHISLSNTNDYVYLQQPMIDWWLSGVSQQAIVVIISWILGALLPIIALLMTAMASNNIRLMSTVEEKKEQDRQEENEPEEIEQKEKVPTILGTPHKRGTINSLLEMK